MFHKNKGFTLIELLVVIAIIGILASIVLVNLNAARNKAKDAAIKAALSESRIAMEMFYDDNSSSYLNGCNGNDLVRIQTNIESNGGTFSCYTGASPDAYCVESSLPTGDFWCVDVTGRSMETSAVQCAAAGDLCM